MDHSLRRSTSHDERQRRVTTKASSSSSRKLRRARTSSSASSSSRFPDEEDEHRTTSSSYPDEYHPEPGPGGNFKVVIRVRPPLPRELDGAKPFQNVVNVDASGKVLTVSENLNRVLGHGDDPTNLAAAYATHVYTFDHVYGQHCTQSEVYENTAKAVVESSLQGYNATIFAYGQTGTGKTYTMEGFNSAGSLEARGIIPRAIEQIFIHIESNVSARNRFLVRASYLQIYNESISDLLKPERNNLSIREDKKRGVFVEGLSEWVVRTPAEIYGLMERGGAMRATGSTKMNEISSRSHAVFIIIAEQSHTTYVDSVGNEISMQEFTTFVQSHQSRDPAKLDSFIRQSFKVGKLNLVDLAGSERVRLSGATGQRLEESKKINQSLSALGNVISALTDAKGRQHIPYRDSKLTRILEDSLGGNCKTTMMAMISPALESMVESLSTLKFANRAKNIKNSARINEDLDQKSLLRKYERELKRLRTELEKKNKNVVDKRRLLELDEQRRRAEQDKMAAIRALEERSLEFMREKQEKRKLEQRISMLTSQMLTSHAAEGGGGGGQENGGEDGSNHPQLRIALKEHQEKIRRDYECRLAELEKERETIEEEKAQVDRYKQLLLKQRDIMIALTQRLNERDEQITALQDELDAYDKHQKELEEKLDEKTAQLIHLQRVTIEHNANSPTKNADLIQALGEWGQNRFAQSKRALTGGELAPPPELLITHKQYVPHSNNGAVELENENDSEEMLSAVEKIKELQLLLEASQAETRQLKQQHSAPSPPTESEVSALSTYQRRLEALEQENAELRQENQGSTHQVHDIQRRCDTLVKERKAVQTIMEQKIKTLVSAVMQASNSTIDRAGGMERLGDSGKWLQREVAALNRLVNASIAALRNAESQKEVAVGKQEEVSPHPTEATTATAAASPSSPRQSSKSGISVEKLIQQRRLQLQKSFKLKR